MQSRNITSFQLCHKLSESNNATNQFCFFLVCPRPETVPSSVRQSLAGSFHRPHKIIWLFLWLVIWDWLFFDSRPLMTVKCAVAAVTCCFQHTLSSLLYVTCLCSSLCNWDLKLWQVFPCAVALIIVCLIVCGNSTHSHHHHLMSCKIKGKSLSVYFYENLRF